MIWLWTEEELKDTLLFAGVVGLTTFCLTIFYRAVDRYLKES